MDIKLSFLGAVGNVTGSSHLFEVNGTKVLIDCGMYQERHFKERNWRPFPVNPSKIDAVILTHAHLDHCGLLPKLVNEGFKGKIYCTQATAEIAKIILLDSAKIQEEDAEHKRKRHIREGRKGPFPEVPLYTTEDAQNCQLHFSPVDYKQNINIGEGLEAALYDAGHVLGSSIIKIIAKKNGEERIILFSGDMGRPDRPIICDPTVFEKADYVLIESTYGDRNHVENGNIKEQIAEVINSTKKAGGNIVVPSFALERSQEILFYINEMIVEKKIKPLKIFLDSPMASKITEVFEKHAELYCDKMVDYIRKYHSPFKQEGLKFAGTHEQSKAINSMKKPIMIVAGSGMCTGGRIKYHLANNISRPESTIMFVGYQASGTLGRQIVDGAAEVRILGNIYPVRARIAKINGFSAHADKSELLKWLQELKTPPRTVFVVHGETQTSANFSDYLREQTGWHIHVPTYQEQITLN